MSAAKEPLDLRLVTPALAAWIGVGVMYQMSITVHVVVVAICGVSVGGVVVYSFYRRQTSRHIRLMAGGVTTLVSLCLISVIVCGSMALWQRASWESEPFATWVRQDTEDVNVTMRISEPPRHRNVTTVVGRVINYRLPGSRTLSTSKASISVFCRHTGELHIGQTVTFRVDLHQGTSGPIGFAKGPPRIAAPSSSAIQKIQGSVSDLVKGWGSASEELIPAMLIGDRSSLSKGLSDHMRQVSLSHLTVVSGLHVGIILMGVWTMLSWARPRLRIGISGLLLMCYMVVTGMGPSIIRAGVMGFVMLIGRATGRPSRALTSLSVAIVVTLIVNPQQALSYSFMLSVIATAAIVLRSGPWAHRLRVIMPAPIAQMVSVPLVAQVWCMPVLLMFQPAIAIYGIVANMLVAPVVTFLLLGAMLAWLLSFMKAIIIVDYIVHAMLYSVSICCAWVDGVAGYLSRAPGAMIPWIGGWWGTLTFIVAMASAVAIMMVYEPVIACRNYLRRRRIQMMDRASRYRDTAGK